MDGIMIDTESLLSTGKRTKERGNKDVLQMILKASLEHIISSLLGQHIL